MQIQSAVRRCKSSLVLFCLLLVAAHTTAQTTRPTTTPSDVTLAYIREFYTKYEYKIPMRDGVKLHVAVYAPKDQSKTYPILLTRTPYGVAPYGVDVYLEPRGMLLPRARHRASWSGK